MTTIDINIDKIKSILEKQDYFYYGLRKDNYKYNIGDTCFKSRQLWQDPEYDWETGELLYPYITDGIYGGYYDGGELDGTCAIEVNLEDVEKKLQYIDECYLGKHLHLIAGDNAGYGNDPDEIIIENAIVLNIIY